METIASILLILVATSSLVTQAFLVYMMSQVTGVSILPRKDMIEDTQNDVTSEPHYYDTTIPLSQFNPTNGNTPTIKFIDDRDNIDG